MNEIVRHQPQELSMQDQMQFAQLVTEGSMVPKDYQGQPANAMIAIGLGQAMGLSPAESLYRISVIQGKPTASAELIASNIRKAGHILRVEVDEQNMSVRATVYRADDPEFPHTVTRDMNWAKQMGLVNKDNYKKQPLTMLQWRAISGVGRLACPEALYGVQYIPEELGDMPAPTRPSRVAQPVEQVAEEPAFESITGDQWNELLAAGQQAGLDPAQVGALAADVLQHDLRGPQDIPREPVRQHPRKHPTTRRRRSQLMAGEPYITVIGNLADDPSLRFTASGHAVASFTIAQTPRSFNRETQQWVDDETLWVRASIWREAAENASESLTKGMRVIAHGRLKARSFETKDGQQRTNWELEVDEIGPSLKWATAQVNRSPRSGGAGGFGAATSAAPAASNWGNAPAGAWTGGGAPQGGQGGPPF